MADTDTPPEGTDQLADESGETTPPAGAGTGGTDDAGTGDQSGQIAALRRENASWRSKLRETEAERDRLKDAPASEQALNDARAEARTEALADSNERLLRAEVIGVAAGKLRDPSDAVKLLDLSTFQVNDKGEVDRKALAAAVDELVKSKPYLAGQADPDFGARTPGKAAGSSMNELIRQRAGK